LDPGLAIGTKTLFLISYGVAPQYDIMSFSSNQRIEERKRC
jgi:hypothetical protein